MKRCFFFLFVVLLISGNASGQVNMHDITDPSTWQTPDWGGKPQGTINPDGGFTLHQPEGRAWAATTKTVSLDVDRYPVLAVHVSALSPGAEWVLKMDNKPYDSSHPYDVQPTPAGGKKPGLYLVDLRALGGWSGRQQIEIRLFVAGSSGAWVTFSGVALLPADRLTGLDIDNTLAEPGSIDLVSNPWILRYKPDKTQFTVCRLGSIGAVTGQLPAGTEAVSSETRLEGENTVLAVKSKSDWGNFETRITSYKQPSHLFRWTVDVDVTQPHVFTPGTPECHHTISPFAPEDMGRAFADKVYPLHLRPGVAQRGVETGNAYSVYDPALGCSVLYLQEFSTLNGYFEATRTTAKESVKSGVEGFGYAMPADPRTTVPAGTRLRLVDTYLLLDDTSLPSVRQSLDGIEECRVYLEMMAKLYDVIPKPATVYTDWKDVAGRVLADLRKPDCWCSFDKGYLRNYVSEPWGPDTAELTVQLDPFLAALRYERRWKETTDVTKRIAPTLPLFYNSRAGTIRDYITDENPSRWDAGWVVYLQTLLLDAAAMGVTDAANLVRDSLPRTIELAHKCNYEFPIFYNPVTLDRFEWAIRDCAGSYAYLMLQAHELFGDPKYLDEARAALGHVAGHGMNLAYELHYTARTAAACARMWKLTGDDYYLRLSYVPVASMVRHSRIWDCRYGHHKDHRLFFGLSCMPAVYIAPYEIYHPWLIMREYDAITHDALPSSVRTLTSEQIKYSTTVLRYTYPPFMSPGSVPETNERGHRNDLSLYIPVEDLNDGWEPSGKIGQEIYGCGGPLAVAAEGYVLMPEPGISVYSEYPLHDVFWSSATRSLVVRVRGVSKYNTQIAVRYDRVKCRWPESAKLQVEGATVIDRVNEDGLLRFRIPGETSIVIKAGEEKKPVPTGKKKPVKTTSEPVKAR